VPPSTQPSPAADAGVFEACSTTRITGCDDLYITFQKTSSDLCVQLSLDNCGIFRGALQVDVPLSWRLSSATVGSANDCAAGSYDPKSISMPSAKGSITWVEDGRQLSQLEIDLTLEPPATASDLDPVSVKTLKPIPSSVSCASR
jgi:hypothetical protein